MALTKVKINLGTEGNLSGSRSIIQTTKTLVSSSAQLSSEISGSFTTASSSFSTRVSTIEGSGTAQGVGTSDSPTFNNLTATGTVTAQEFHSEFVSASVTFTSGSHKFGNSGDDIQHMTGSLRLSGSITNESYIIGTNVGIGTNNPATKLHIQGSGNTDGIRLANTGYSYYNEIKNNGDGLLIDVDKGDAGGAGADLRINISDTERLRITNDGELGINSNNPDEELEVFGATDVGIKLRALGTTTTAGSHVPTISLQSNQGDGVTARASISADRDGASTKGALIFSSRVSDNITEVMRINGSGNVGIGTTSPSSLLEVSGSSGTVATIYGGSSPTLLFEAGAGDTNFIFKQGGSNRFLLGYEDGDAGFRFYDYNSSTTMVFFKNGGNVGIGTTNPGVQLDIYNTDHAILRLLAGTNKSASMRLRNDAQDWDVNLQTNDNFAIYDQTGAANALTIAPSTYAATFSGDVTISKNDAKLTVFASNTGDKEAIVIDRNTASNGDSQEIRWKLQGDSYPGGYILHEYDDASNSSLAFGVRDNGTPGTALSIDSSKNATFTSMVKASFFRTDVTATSVANATWTNISGLTSLSAGLYIIHVYKDNYAANDWSARGIVEATGHSTIDGDFENQTGFQLRVNGSDVQLYHTLGSTFGITARWIKIG